MLQFNPVLVAEWVGQLHEAKFGGSSNRVIQFLNLLRIPVDLRVRLKGMPDLTEAKLRPMIQKNRGKIRAVTQRLPGVETKVKDM